MNIKDLVNVIRTSPDEYVYRFLIELFEHYWGKGYTARLIDEKKLKGFAERNRLRFENEVEIIRDKLIQQGVPTSDLEDAIRNYFLTNNQ